MACPHIALLDPRTGRLLWRKDKFIDADALIEKVSDFCSRYSLEEGGALPTAAPTAPAAAPPPIAMPRADSSASSAHVDGVSEEDALAAAIAASLEPVALDSPGRETERTLAPADGAAQHQIDAGRAAHAE